MKLTVKEIIAKTIENLQEVKMTIEELQCECRDHLGVDGTFTDTKVLFEEIDKNIKNLSTIENTILVALCAAIYAGNIEGSGRGFIDDFGADSLSHRAEYLAFAEQYDLPYDDEGLIATDCVYDNVSEYMWSTYTENEEDNI